MSFITSVVFILYPTSAVGGTTLTSHVCPMGTFAVVVDVNVSSPCGTERTTEPPSIPASRTISTLSSLLEPIVGDISHIPHVLWKNMQSIGDAHEYRFDGSTPYPTYNLVPTTSERRAFPREIQRVADKISREKLWICPP